MSQWFNIEAALQTNGVTKSDVKEVIKKLLENAHQWKGGEKKAKDTNDRINTTNVDWNLELECGNHFYSFILDYHEFIFS